MGPQMLQAQQRWSITPAPAAGGCPGAPHFRIGIADTDRVLAATASAELVVAPVFTGAPEQLWCIDQLTDGTYRLMPKAVPEIGTSDSWALSAAGSSTPTLAKFRADSDRQRWVLKAP
jgi:arabinan endo-1,5-alpha-L-arabinosidase